MPQNGWWRSSASAAGEERGQFALMIPLSFAAFCLYLSCCSLYKSFKQEFLGTEFTQTNELGIQVKTVKLVNNIIYVGKSNKDIETSEPIKHDE